MQWAAALIVLLVSSSTTAPPLLRLEAAKAEDRGDDTPIQRIRGASGELAARGGEAVFYDETGRAQLLRGAPVDAFADVSAWIGAAEKPSRLYLLLVTSEGGGSGEWHATKWLVLVAAGATIEVVDRSWIAIGETFGAGAAGLEEQDVVPTSRPRRRAYHESPGGCRLYRLESLHRWPALYSIDLQPRIRGAKLELRPDCQFWYGTRPPEVAAVASNAGALRWGRSSWHMHKNESH